MPSSSYSLTELLVGGKNTNTERASKLLHQTTLQESIQKKPHGHLEGGGSAEDPEHSQAESGGSEQLGGDCRELPGLVQKHGVSCPSSCKTAGGAGHGCTGLSVSSFKAFELSERVVFPFETNLLVFLI